MTEAMRSKLQPQPTSAVAVLIVGAGPAGLTLACELARRGISYRLVEKAPGPQPGSRGKGVQPRSLEVFEDLGVVDRVLAHGRMAMPIRSTSPDGQVTSSGSVPETLRNRPDIPYPASLITPEWRIEETLRLRLAELGGGVEFTTRLNSFEQSDESVSADLWAGGEIENVTARWMVACDGGHSIVRKQAGIHFNGDTRPEVRVIVADVEIEGLDRQAWQMWRHSDGALSLCPLPSTELFQLQASISPGQDPKLNVENLQAIVDRRSGGGIRIRTVAWSTLWRANVRLVDRYNVGQVFLAGDAAHIHSPAGGQGMNTGIQDAHNLGWKLAAVDHGASPTLLDNYEQERRPVAARVLELSDARLNQALHEKSLPSRREEAATQLDVGYRSSGIVCDDRDETYQLRAGDRAPDAAELDSVDGSHRLFDLTGGGRFTLLNFGAELPAASFPPEIRVLRVVDDPTKSEQIADIGGHLTDTYEAADHSLILIRPDGYISFISDTGDTSTLPECLSAWGKPIGGKASVKVKHRTAGHPNAAAQFGKGVSAQSG